MTNTDMAASPMAAPAPHPLFSVLIPSFNRPEFVGIAVASVLSSNRPDVEVVVSDDCSPRWAEIKAVLEPFAHDARLRVVAQPQNLREPANRAFLQRAARGDWVLYLSDDDLLEPGALDDIEQYITRYPSVRLFVFGYRLIDEHGREYYRRSSPRPLELKAEPGFLLEEFLVADAFPYWFFQPASFCVRREIGETVTPHHGIGMGDDLLFLFEYLNGPDSILVIPKVLMSYRKFSPAALGVQPNQSLVRGANVETRFRIMQVLSARNDLHPAVATVVHSKRFRDRFAYSTAVIQRMTLSDVEAIVSLSEFERVEYTHLWRSRTARSLRVRGYVRRTIFFVRLFGAAGLREASRVGAQYLLAGWRTVLTARTHGQSA